MELIDELTQRLSRIPAFVWLLVAIGFGAFLAIFVFGVPLRAAANYAVLALFWGGHMFMHGSHGHHRDHGSHHPNVEPGNASKNPQEGDQEHSGGCH